MQVRHISITSIHHHLGPVCGSGSPAGRESGAGGTKTYLARECTGTEVSERKLESLVAPIDIDLQCDQRVGVCDSS